MPPRYIIQLIIKLLFGVPHWNHLRLIVLPERQTLSMLCFIPVESFFEDLLHKLPLTSKGEWTHNFDDIAEGLLTPPISPATSTKKQPRVPILVQPVVEEKAALACGLLSVGSSPPVNSVLIASAECGCVVAPVPT